MLSELLSHQIGQAPQPSTIRWKWGICNQAQAGPAAGTAGPDPPVTYHSCTDAPVPLSQLTQMAFPLPGCGGGQKPTHAWSTDRSAWPVGTSWEWTSAAPQSHSGVVPEDSGEEKSSQEPECGAGHPVTHFVRREKWPKAQGTQRPWTAVDSLAGRREIKRTGDRRGVGRRRIDKSRCVGTSLRSYCL